jgi:serine/threonine protein kinase
MVNGDEVSKLKAEIRLKKKELGPDDTILEPVQIGEEVKSEKDIEEDIAEFYEGLVGTHMLIGPKDESGGEEVVLEEFAGKGNMAGVFKARCKDRDKPIALKVLSPYLARFPGFVDRFDDEGRTMMELPPDHPNLVAGYFRGVDKRNTFDFAFGRGVKKMNLHAFGMEFVEGETLDDKMKAQALKAPPGLEHLPSILVGIEPFPIKYSCDIILQIAAALAITHSQDNLHRDIKPGNIIITPGGVAKLTDFGLVKEFGAADKTAAGIMVGTPLYMSPDQVVHDFYYTSDLWSLSVILYQMVTGQLPFRGLDKKNNYSDNRLVRQIMSADPIPPKDFNPHVASRLQHAILRAMDKRVHYRHLNVKEFVDEMKMICKKVFSDDVKAGWYKEHAQDKRKKGVFDMTFSHPFVNLSEELIGTQREIVYECEQIERELLEKKVAEFDIAAAGLGTRVRAVKDFEELIRRTPMTRATIKKRWRWINNRLDIYARTEKNKPEFTIDKTSAKYQLNFEEKMMNAWKIPKPDERSLTEKYGKVFTIGTITFLLAVIGAFGLHFYFAPKVKAEREAAAKIAAHQQALADFDTGYENIRSRIVAGELDDVKEGLEALAEKGIRLDDGGLKTRVEELRQSAAEKKKEKERDNLYVSGKKSGADAYAAIREISNAELGKELSKEEINNLLAKAKGLSSVVLGIAKQLSGDRKDELKDSAADILRKIGPKIYALDTFDAALASYKKVHGSYKGLQQEWEKNASLAHGRIKLLRKEIEDSTRHLAEVKRDFTEAGKTTPRYSDLSSDLVLLARDLIRFHSEICTDQLDLAKINLRDIIEAYDGLKSDYLADDAAKKDLAAASLEEEVKTLLANIEGSIFVRQKDIEGASARLKRLVEGYNDTRERIRNIAGFKKEKNHLEMGKAYFAERKYEDAEAELKKVKGDGAGIYLRVISLEKIGRLAITVSGYAGADYTGLRLAIDTYKSEQKGEMIILECLKVLKANGCTFDFDDWGEAVEALVLKKKGGEEQAFGLLDKYRMKIDELVRSAADAYEAVGLVKKAEQYRALLE